MNIVFHKQWFENHQSKLIWLLNNRLTCKWFRWVLSIDCDKTINRIEPNAYWYGAEKKGTGIEVTADFRTHDKYAKRLYNAFKPLWFIAHVWDFFADNFAPNLSFGFDTLTAYPDADPETTTVDGYVRFDTGTSGAWATAVAATAGTSVDDSSTSVIQVMSRESPSQNNNFGICRAFVLFDTSALTAGATISTSVLSGVAWVSNFGDNDAQAYINVYSTNPASNTALVLEDYDQVGSTAFSTSKTISSVDVTGSVYTDFTLNGSGLAAISKTGITKLGWREGHDVENSAIATNAENYVWFYPADQTGTSKDPKLVITYTVPSAQKFLTLLGVG